MGVVKPLVQQSANPDDHSWAKRIANEYCDDIQIIKRVSKDQESSRVSFNAPASLDNIVERMMYDRIGYSSKTEFQRAAYHIGVFILYHLAEDNLSNNTKAAKRISDIDTRYNLQADSVDQFIACCDKLVKLTNSNAISTEDANNEIRSLIECYPEYPRENLEVKARSLIQGCRKTDLFESQHRGGKTR